MNILGYSISQEQIMNFALVYGSHLVMALLILFIGWTAAKILRNVVAAIMARAHLEQILIHFLSNIIYGLALAFVIIASLNQLGVETASLIAILGAAGLAIGLALQGSLSNFAAGIMIIIFKHFKLGDVISTGNITGTVADMNIFTTTLNTATNERVIVPNNLLTSGMLTNITANKQRRVDLVFGVGYHDDLDTVSEVLSGIITADKRILKTPDPVIEIDSLGDNSVNVAIRVWAKTGDYGGVRGKLLREVKRQFDEKGITFPYPQRDVHYVAEPPEQVKKPAARKTPAKKA